MRLISGILIGTITALGGGYGFVVATTLAPTCGLQVAVSSRNPEDVNALYAVTQHGNPGGHVAFNHTLSVTVRVPKDKNMTDEQLLVRLVKGYYGGWVIAPERWALAAVNADIVDFEGVPKPNNVWSPALRLRERLPPPHHILMGAFQVLDKHMDDDLKTPSQGFEKGFVSRLPARSRGGSSARYSYVDFGFGNNKGTFSGVNRFAVVSEPDPFAASDATRPITAQHGVSGPLEAGRRVRLMFSAVACNPSVNEMTISGWILAVHKVYVLFLFREAVSRVLADC